MIENRIVVIPTYRNHFAYIETLVQSWRHFSQDSSIPLFFIVSDKDELIELNQLIMEIELKNYSILSIEDILASYGIHISSTELLKKLGRFSYQTIKKLYALYYLDYTQALILDSETIAVSSMQIQDLFSDYFSSPYVLYSVMPKDDSYKNWIDYKTSKNCAELLDFSFRQEWYLEGFHWFYEKRIINDLFEFFDNDLFGTIYSHCERNTDDSEKAIFECVLYYTFVRKNNDTYRYRFIDARNELAHILGKNCYEKLCNRMNDAGLGFLPFAIHSVEYANASDLKKFSSFYRKYNIRIARVGCEANVIKPRAFKKICHLFRLRIVCATDRVNEKYKYTKQMYPPPHAISMGNFVHKAG